VTGFSAIDLRVRAENVSVASLQNRSIGLNPLERLDGFSRWRETAFQPIDVNDSLKFLNLTDGSYAISMAPIPGAYVGDVRQGDSSIYNTGTITVHGNSAKNVEVVLRTDGAKVEGVVVGVDGKPATICKVTLVPQGDRRLNALLYRNMNLRDGHFSFVDIAPGTYKLFAWENIPFGAEQNAAYMAPYEARGHIVSLTPGESTSNITLSLIRAK